jgi:hypothetical protein
VAQIYPRALGSLSVASYDSQGYSAGILSSLHTGLTCVCVSLCVCVCVCVYIYKHGNRTHFCGISFNFLPSVCVYIRIFLERYESKALHMIVDSPCYVPNTVIRRDLQIPTVKEEIRRYSSQYSARLSAHPNDLIVNIIELPDNRRLRRHLPNICLPDS